ncbi:MAG: YitT family protein, partial [Faecalibacillus sp.]
LIINKYTGISTTFLINAFDCVILAIQIPFSNIEQILYGILVVIMTALVMDKIIMLGEVKAQVIVISPKWEEIKTALFNTLDRGCTLLNIKTGYKQEKMYAVMAVVSMRELHKFTNAILDIDETAFIVTNQTHNVRGRGFTLPNIDL